MAKDNISLLIEILFDRNAREDERHDAAMDIGNYNDDRVLNALTIIASNPKEEDVILDAAGESIAKIFVKRGLLDNEIINKLTPIAWETADAYIRNHRSDWINKY